MAKSTMVYFCKECGYETSKWLGQCPGCGQWNSMVEEPARKKVVAKVSNVKEGQSKVSPITDISLEAEEKLSTGLGELDRVLGGGIVKGSLILVGGDPGIGKSTLLLQVCKNISERDNKVLYISGEESLKQIKIRANRMGEFSSNLLLLCETSLDNIEVTIKRENPKVVVIDSIQTMYKEDVAAAPGSVSQVRESTNILMQIAKNFGISIFVVGHVTKEGVVAGPRVWSIW